MKVELEKTIDYDSYGDFVKRIKNTTFYQSRKHLEFLESMVGSKAMVISAKENDELKAVFPFFIKETKYGKVLNSLPFFGSYGSIVSDHYEAQKNILELLNNFNKENDILSSVIITNPFNRNDEIYNKFYKHNSREERLIQCADFKNKSQDTLWNEFEQRVRRSIRKSEKNSVIVSSINEDEQAFERFYELHKNDMESKNGRPKPPEFFKYVKKHFIRGEDYDIFTATKNNDEIAYLLVFYFSPFTEYYMPAYRPDLKHLQSTSLLIWESMKKAIKRDMGFYNFGGTWKNQRELYMFKKGWNSADYQYDYFIYRDISRINAIGLEGIRENFGNFYVTKYDEIKHVS